MFKTLIGTFLLCTSLGAYKPKQNLNNSMTLRGAYTLRDQFEFSVSSTLSLHFEHDEHNILISGVNNNYLGYYELGYLTVNLYDDDLFDFKAYEYDGAFYINAEDVVYNTLSYLKNYASDEDVVENFVLYFANDYLITGNECLVFNTFFTGGGNQYVHSYNGWYNFTNHITVSTNFEILGNFIAENKYMDTFTHFGTIDPYTVGFSILRYDYGSTSTYEERANRRYGNTYYNIGNVQVNCLLPKIVYDTMLTEGVFQFINDVPNTTFSEMIFSVMDAPLYYLTSLFSFELFGVNMFVAFSSIITLVVVMVIIRKVI